MSDSNPTPWRLEGNAIWDAEDGVVVSAFNPCGRETRQRIVDAMNEHDRLDEDIESWRRGYIKARTERNAYLLERDRLRADLRSLADEFDGYAEADGIRAPAYASLFRSLAERLRGMVEARPAAVPLGRPATEEEVDGGKAQWCQVCVADCPLAGRDALGVCDAFEEGGSR